jgi:hypothetical protein
MAWALLLLTICEVALEEAALAKKRALGAATKKLKSNEKQLSEAQRMDSGASRTQVDTAFKNIWKQHSAWAEIALKDALDFAAENISRPDKERIQIRRVYESQESPSLELFFTEKVWPFLADRGWRVDTEAKQPGLVIFLYQSEKVSELATKTAFNFRISHFLRPTVSLDEICAKSDSGCSPRVRKCGSIFFI